MLILLLPYPWDVYHRINFDFRITNKLTLIYLYLYCADIIVVSRLKTIILSDKLVERTVGQGDDADHVDAATCFRDWPYMGK